MQKYIDELIRYFDVPILVDLAYTFLPIIFLIIIFRGLEKWDLRIRNRRLQEYVFPSMIKLQVQMYYPNLNEYQIDRVLAGLRAYFSICLLSRQKLYLPSKVINIAWREFSNLTQEYNVFSDFIFGKEFAFVPFVKLYFDLLLKNQYKDWKIYCKNEKIDPIQPKFLPYLYWFDAELKIKDGYIYDIEFGLYPKQIKEHIISPAELINEITNNISEDVSFFEMKSIEREVAVYQVSKKIKDHIFDDNYINLYINVDYKVLFGKILAREDLALAVFGDMSRAKQRQAEIQLLIENAMVGC